MTIDEALRQLKSSDPTIRRQAVIEIGKSKNPSMLSILADVYKGDGDPDVRAIAFKAGQYIKANMGPNAPTDPAPAPVPAAPVSVPAATPHVSELNRERASSYLSQALDHQMRGDILKASENLGRAFDHNPGLADDPLAKNLAADLTGQGPTPAVRTFLDRTARAQFIASKGGRKVPAGSGNIPLATPESGETSWGGAILDLLIYGLAVGALTFIVLIVAAQPLVNLMTAAAAQTSMTGAQAQVFQQELHILQSASSLAFALPVALISGFSAIVGLLIECGIEHLIVKTMLGGTGLLTSLIHKLAFFQIVLIPIGGVLAVIFLLVLIPQFDQNPPNVSGIFPVLWLVGLGFGVFTLYYRAHLIGRNYSISTGKGCLAIFLYTIVVAVLQFCLSSTLTSVISSFFNQAGSTGGVF